MTTLTTALAPGSGLARAEASYAAKRRRKLVVAALVFAALVNLPVKEGAIPRGAAQPA